ncbi:transcriptional regulator, GntR family [Ruminococcaceae bacterium KH2T8]|nr:transcriptional regulator, GntR family [Ruminococcaceae bacterium KH2T8]SMC70156.1 GntR family transcriptional regulator / MocR family aminotransferase [Oscillospiraceae bacterium]
MITINKNTETPIYKQIYEQIKRDILNGSLTSGMRLPASRSLAAEYHISRNSVVAAYDQLVIEGFITSKTGSGYYVEELHFLPKRDHDKVDRTQYSSKKSTVEELKYNFRYGNLEYNCYQDSNWRKCINAAMDVLANSQSTNYLPAEGLQSLREELALFLRRTRGVNCIPEQVIVTSGHQYALDIISKLFISRDHSFAMEDPGYDGCRELFIRNGHTPIAIPVETDGINLDAVYKIKKSLLYITPSHQFPTGSILPVSKRLSLLEYAAKTGSFIIEDDYDSELRYNAMPIPSLQSMDEHDRTIYIGTFSKSLSPDLRIAYIILPLCLLNEYRKKFRISNSSVPTILQIALCEYIKSGNYERYVNAIRTHYKHKNAKILSGLNLDSCDIIGSAAGLHFLINIHTSSDQDDIVNHFLKYDVAVYPTKRYWIRKELCPEHQILVGYSSIPYQKLDKAIEQFNRALETLCV